MGIVGGRIRVTGGFNGNVRRSEVLEYHPEPWDQWLNVGNLQAESGGHNAVVSIGPQQLACLSTECPPLPPSPSHLCAATTGVQYCHYSGDHCCCGGCSDSFTFSCLHHDSTTGAGHWQSDLCPVEGCGSKGVVTSPNYPNNYDNYLLRTDTIQVEEGLVISLHFTAFNIVTSSFNCPYDHLTITDGDGTTLMEKSCGPNSQDSDGNIEIGGQNIGTPLPPNITSRSNVVKLHFKTDYLFASIGWSVSWSAVAPDGNTPPSSSTATTTATTTAVLTTTSSCGEWQQGVLLGESFLPGYQGAETAGPVDCAKLCGSVQDCAAWTFHLGLNRCWLKTTDMNPSYHKDWVWGEPCNSESSQAMSGRFVNDEPLNFKEVKAFGESGSEG